MKSQQSKSWQLIPVSKVWQLLDGENNSVLAPIRKKVNLWKQEIEFKITLLLFTKMCPCGELPLTFFCSSKTKQY